jgi:glycosyltransferase involved in cell wall biosynthesis
MFLPAHNEEATVADVVRRAPTEVRGHPVEVVVVDDGSTDGTAAAAAGAGATVLSFGTNRGLGAAVREGLAAGVARGAAAVAFLDADGEYAPTTWRAPVSPAWLETCAPIDGWETGCSRWGSGCWCAAGACAA